MIYLGIVLDLADFNLSWDVKTVDEITAKHKRVIWSKYSMDPPYEPDNQSINQSIC